VKVVTLMTDLGPVWFEETESKVEEYARTITLFEKIFMEEGVHLALTFLYNIQYGPKDILGMMEVRNPGKNSLVDRVKAHLDVEWEVP